MLRSRESCTVRALTLPRRGLSLLFGLAVLTGCKRSSDDFVQGYVEGEFVYVASPLAGQLQTLSVHRGQEVKGGEKLFSLESGLQTAARDAAAERLRQSESSLLDLTKGRRPTEIDAIKAQLKEANASLDFNEKQVARYEKLRNSGAVPEQDYDRVRSARDQDKQRVSQLNYDLLTAQLPAREDQVSAAEAATRMQKSSLDQANWDLSQKEQSAPEAGLVFDTLFREGEWVPAGRPVIALLPPKNIKVRAFVHEKKVGALHVGDSLSVRVDGVTEPFTGKISYISPRAEFTPPVIYSNESRTKLVFMVEAVFEPDAAARLHPGQPVDVELQS